MSECVAKTFSLGSVTFLCYNPKVKLPLCWLRWRMSWIVPKFCSFSLLSILLFTQIVAHELRWFQLWWRPSYSCVFYFSILAYTGALLMQVHQTNRTLSVIFLTMYADFVLVLTCLSFPLHFHWFVLIPVMMAFILGCKVGAAALVAVLFQNAALYNHFYSELNRVMCFE